MESVAKIIVCLIQAGLVSGTYYCYSRKYNNKKSCYGYGYCGGYDSYKYCSNYYNDYYSIYERGSLTVGAIVGIIIGSIIFLAMVIGIIIAVFARCTKSAGTKGRVINPASASTGITVVHSTANLPPPRPYSFAPPAPPYFTKIPSSPNHDSSLIPSPPPKYVPADEPPPTYSVATAQNGNIENPAAGVRLPPIQPRTTHKYL